MSRKAATAVKLEDRSVEELNREQEIFDRGYDAVRTMAKEMIANGATVADVLFHADQLWHEFKVGAFLSQTDDDPKGIAERERASRLVTALLGSGMYIDGCNRKFTDTVIRSYNRYANGSDEVRNAVFVAALRRQARRNGATTDESEAVETEAVVEPEEPSTAA
jgi:hypothetical protein